MLLLDLPVIFQMFGGLLISEYDERIRGIPDSISIVNTWITTEHPSPAKELSDIHCIHGVLYTIMLKLICCSVVYLFGRMLIQMNMSN